MKDLTVKTAEHVIADAMKLISIRVNFFQWFILIHAGRVTVIDLQDS